MSIIQYINDQNNTLNNIKNTSFILIYLQNLLFHVVQCTNQFIIFLIIYNKKFKKFYINNLCNETNQIKFH